MCATTDARMVQTSENCEGPAVAVLRQGGRCRVATGAVPAVMNVAVIMQRQLSREQWKCHTFRSSPELVDIFVRNRDRHFSAMMAVKGFFLAVFPQFSLSSGFPRVQRQFSEPSMTKSSSSSQSHSNLTVASCGHTHLVPLTCFRNNNNNNTIWGGSVLTGEEPPPHSGELKHALTQAGGPTQSQLSRPMSSGHHISMEHRLRKKQLNSDTNATIKNI